jgi:UDP-N-acetylglucosamine:LPS N-acetylglucosamine transferase
MGKSGQRRILAVASAGGHWVQLGRLSEAFADSDTLYVTTVAGETAPSGNRRVARISDASRNEPWRVVIASLQLALLMLRFRPQAVITTGAAPGYVALRLAKLRGCRTVWLDSIANAEEISMSARLARPYADLWLTQWEELSRQTPGLEYWGQIL